MLLKSNSFIKCNKNATEFEKFEVSMTLMSHTSIIRGAYISIQNYLNKTDPENYLWEVHNQRNLIVQYKMIVRSILMSLPEPTEEGDIF